MARRARQGVSPIQIAVIVAAVAAVGGGLLFALNRSKDSLRAVSEMDVAEYVRNGTGMGGTEWKLTGTVKEKLSYTPDRGQIITVLVEQSGQRTELGVFIPPELNSVSINPGDRFTIRVEVDGETYLVARELIRA